MAVAREPGGARALERTLGVGARGVRIAAMTAGGALVDIHARGTTGRVLADEASLAVLPRELTSPWARGVVAASEGHDAEHGAEDAAPKPREERWTEESDARHGHVVIPDSAINLQ